MCPTGGIDKVGSFLSLFGGNKLNVAVLTDFATGQKGKVQRLKESELLQSSQVYTIADFIDKDEGDIEDLMPPDVFIGVLNEAYSLETKDQLTSIKLAKSNEKTERQVVQAEDYFKLLPSTVPEFNHFTPSDWLIRNPQYLDTEGESFNKALQTFEDLFVAFNKMLD